MAGTTTDGIPYPQVGDNLTPLATWFANLATGVQSALNLRSRVYTASTQTALPTTGLTAGVSRGWATDTRRLFLWDGTKWILIGGAVPYANVRVASDMTMNTTYNVIGTQNGGIAASSTFTIPPGCGGVYDFAMTIRTGNGTNTMIQPYVNGVASGKEAISGGQDTLTNVGQLALNAGDTVQFRAKVFAGTGTMSAGNSWMSLAFRGGA